MSRSDRSGRAGAPIPPHHLAGGGFRNPWPIERPEGRPSGGFLRWQWERLRNELPPNPQPADLPRGEPDIAAPRAPADEVRITWVGHATFLLQIGGCNVLTDPVWSERASPLPWLGPKRFVPPGLPWAQLPPIDAVLVSHDHYDHLDGATVKRLHERFGADLRWFVPLGYRGWFAERGVRSVTELDWWQEERLTSPGGELRITAHPARHWTKRNALVPADRLWAGWSLATAEHRCIFFAGDTGYFPGFGDIGRRAGPFDAVLLPIGAYEPRWFMRASHMNPEEAVQAYLDLGGRGDFVAMHWGTFRLTDEDPLEPPKRTRAAWRYTRLPEERLWIPGHGETRLVE